MINVFTRTDSSSALQHINMLITQTSGRSQLCGVVAIKALYNRRGEATQQNFPKTAQTYMALFKCIFYHILCLRNAKSHNQIHSYDYVDKHVATFFCSIEFGYLRRYKASLHLRHLYKFFGSLLPSLMPITA